MWKIIIVVLVAFGISSGFFGRFWRGLKKNYPGSEVERLVNRVMGQNSGS